MAHQLTLPAPGKLNLFLHITGRRADGYHLLQTVFQFIDYSDELTLVLREDGKIVRRNQVAGVAQENDLTLRAALALQKETNVHLGADIYLQKRLPIGGGVGGGSSNAATVLLGLNKLWQTSLSLDQLLSIAETLGADVPLFVRGQACWAEGIGEKMTPIDLPLPWFLVLVPPVTVATAEIFADSRLTRDCSPLKIPPSDRDFAKTHFVNVFEPLIRERYPQIDLAMNFLSIYAEAKLTGTGACVFAAFDSFDRAHSVLSQCPVGLKGFVAKGLNESPLHLSI